MPKEQHTKAERRSVYRLWRAGKRVVEIAEITGVPRRTVQGWLADAAMFRPRTRPPIHSPAIRARAVELNARGMSCRDIAEVIGDGLRAGTVAAWVQRDGTPQPRGRRAGS